MQTQFGNMDTEALKAMRKLLPEIWNLPDELSQIVESKREKLEREWPDGFTWAWLYELETKHFCLIGLAVLGLLPLIEKARKEKRPAHELLIEAVLANAEPLEWGGGLGGQFSKFDLLAIQVASMGMTQSIGLYGQLLSKLVADAASGNDEALFQAISVDRTVVSLPFVAGRLARASLLNDEAFLQQLRKALKQMPHDNLKDHQDLKFFLHLLNELDSLASLPASDADWLFIQELKVYSSKGEDPARSLQRFIQRWKSCQQSTT